MLNELANFSKMGGENARWFSEQAAILFDQKHREIVLIEPGAKNDVYVPCTMGRVLGWKSQLEFNSS